MIDITFADKIVVVRLAIHISFVNNMKILSFLIYYHTYSDEVIRHCFFKGGANGSGQDFSLKSLKLGE